MGSKEADSAASLQKSPKHLPLAALIPPSQKPKPQPEKEQTSERLTAFILAARIEDRVYLVTRLNISITNPRYARRIFHSSSTYMNSTKAMVKAAAGAMTVFFVPI
jgi:hypothetical protein